MSKAHHELRERLKGAVVDLRSHLAGEFSRRMMQSPDDVALKQVVAYWDSLNMRQTWGLSRVYNNGLTHNMGGKFSDERHKLEMAVYRAGLDYYDAKKPGLKKSLMLEKLSRP